MHTYDLQEEGDLGSLTLPVLGLPTLAPQNSCSLPSFSTGVSHLMSLPDAHCVGLMTGVVLSPVLQRYLPTAAVLCLCVQPPWRFRM